MTTLTDSDVLRLGHELDANGYAVLRGVVSREALEPLRADVSDAYGRASRMRGGGAVTGHLNSYPGVAARPAYADLVSAGVVDGILALRAGKPSDMRVTMNFNLPLSVAQHYHIDGFYTDDFLVCNVAVVDTDLDNGAIDVLPGTNRQFLKFWQYALHRTYRRSTRLPMEQGDVLLRKSTLWHRGMPNKTSTPRPLLSYTFGEVSAPSGEDPFLQHGGGIQFFPNWYSTTKLGYARERTFKALPITYSAYRFARSIYGNKGYSA